MRLWEPRPHWPGTSAGNTTQTGDFLFGRKREQLWYLKAPQISRAQGCSTDSLNAWDTAVLGAGRGTSSSGPVEDSALRGDASMFDQRPLPQAVPSQGPLYSSAGRK